jgi:dTDP-4-amino-4,6-dideoxygalactose transaminase
MKIPFNKPYTSKLNREVNYAGESILSGHIHGKGPFTNKVEEYLSRYYCESNIFMTTSCSHSLEIALRLLNLSDGDEVIIPSFNFPSSGNAVLLNGLVIKYAPVDKFNLCIDVDALSNIITDKTKCVIPVHYAGNSCNMDKLMNLARKNNFYVIEDAAQGYGAGYKGRPLGSIGHMGCISFHGTKNVSSGEGGALIINDKTSVLGKKYTKNAEIIIEKGTNRTSFTRKEVAKYEWVSIGSSYVPSDVLMAILYAQLKEEDFITKRRKEIYNIYHEYFSGIKDKELVRSYAPYNEEGNGHIFYVVFKEEKHAVNYISYMKKSGIDVVKHFVALHTSKKGKEFYFGEEDLSFEEDLSLNLVRLPIYPDLTEDEVAYILESTDSFFSR